MRVLIVDTTFSKIQRREVNFIPSIGMTVDWLYYPSPKVSGVLAYPVPSTVAKFTDKEEVFDAIIFLGGE